MEILVQVVLQVSAQAVQVVVAVQKVVLEQVVPVLLAVQVDLVLHPVQVAQMEQVVHAEIQVVAVKVVK